MNFEYNSALANLFSQESTLKEWRELFTPGFSLKNEALLFQEILGN